MQGKQTTPFQLMYSNNKLPRIGEIIGASPLIVINKPKKRVFHGHDRDPVATAREITTLPAEESP